MDQAFRIFVVEDDEWYRELLVYNLELNPDYLVEKFETAEDCLAALHRAPDVITLDFRLPDMNGDEALKKIKDRYPDVEVIVISEQDNVETAVSLLRNGAYDYLVNLFARSEVLGITVQVTRAIDPSIADGHVTHVVLIEFVSVPIQIGLSKFRRSNDDIHWDFSLPAKEEQTLKKTSIPFHHLERYRA